MQRGDQNGKNDLDQQKTTQTGREGVVVSVIPQASVLQAGTVQQYAITGQQLQALTGHSQNTIGVVQSIGGNTTSFTLQPQLGQNSTVQPPTSVLTSTPTVTRLVAPVQTLISTGQATNLSDINVLQQQLSSSNIVNVSTISPQTFHQQPLQTATVHVVSGTVVSPQVEQRQRNITSSTSSVSPSGGTIHHHGQSPTRGGQPPLSNLQQNRLSMSINQQAQQLAQRRSSQTSPGSQGTPVSNRTVIDTRQLMAHPIGTLTSPSSRVITTQSGQPPRKKMKLEEKPPATPDIGRSRRLILDQHYKSLSEIKESCIENLTELFFLQNSGNMMDFHAWKKRPTPQLVQFLKSSNFDSDEEEEHLQEKRINDEVKVLTSAGSNVPLATPVAISTTLPPCVSALSQQGSDSKLSKSGQSSGSRSPGVASGLPVQPTAVGELTTTVDVSLPVPGSVILSTTSATPTTSSTQLQIHLSKNVSQPLSIKTTQSLKTPLSSPGLGTGSTVKIQKSPPLSPRQHTRQQSISAVYDSSIGSQEAIVERAKQEAQVMQRVAEMRKEGMWSSRRLPKVHEPPRNKAHWDYLLEEMQWLATDFVQERKWKKAACRKIARMVAKYHQELEQKEVRAEKEEAQKLKRTATQMAKIVKEFWSNIEKVVQYKQQSRMEERKKKALDVHLNFIVDQTEKYSSWLTETLHTGSSVGPSSVNGSISSPAQSSEGDFEFEPVGTASDDEETIEKEENESGIDDESTKKELEELQKESELPIEDLLKTLPNEVLNQPAALPKSDSSSEEEKCSDDEFKANQDDADLEDTIDEQEKHEKKDNQKELDELQAEGEMSMEDLVKKYAGAYDSDFEMPESEEESTDDEESEESAKESSSEEEEEEEEEDNEDDDEKQDVDVGLDFLLKPQEETDTSKQVEVKVEEKLETGPGKEITDIAAEALSLQPKGYTLETTEVKTVVPFLLKHTLREYQHVGLDWLATMYSKRLNGILADEMGLGKTIQTISVLAHLACEKGVWGPHLIVVPTSVMLNWEIELKKWCPAFKILTYYGSQKERKLKRQGWTKTNAFHVCITSYKLVIQDHAAFRRKKWKYLILDEAQNIKNFKSQRWQMLLNFQSQRRLLLTGTPLQNSLMELWSLMHFLMPHVFQSHKEFKEWFANPLTGMVEGSQDYNDSLVKRLHKVLRPFLLRRLKDDVEKQMPKKYEHVVMCKLSKRQRYLYDEFMGQTKTRDTLHSGDFLSVINVLMQLRKVCNHPNLFDPRPIVSPFQMEGIVYTTASIVLKALQYDPFKDIDVRCLYPSLAEMELNLPAFVAHRVRNLQTPGKVIEEIDDYVDPTPKLKPGRLKNLNFRSSSPAVLQPGRASPLVVTSQQRSASPLTFVRLATPTSRSDTPPISIARPTPISKPLKVNIVSQPSLIGVTGGSKLSLLSSSSSTLSTTTSSPSTTRLLPQQIQGLLHTSGSSNMPSQPITVQIQQTEQGTRLMIPTSQFSQLPAGLIQIVQTGQQLISTTSSASTLVQPVAPIQIASTQGKMVVVSTASVSTINTSVAPITTPVITQVKTTPVQLPSGSIVAGQKPVMRVTPLSTTDLTTTSSTKTLSSLSTVTAAQAANAIAAVKTSESPTANTTTTPVVVAKRRPSKPPPQSELHLKILKEKREKHRKAKLELIAKINKRHCDVKPVYGHDLCEVVNIWNDLGVTSVNNNTWHGLGSVHCHNATQNNQNNKHYWEKTSALSNMVHTPEQYLDELKEILNRYVFVTPSVTVPSIQLHVSHPPPSYLVEQQYRNYTLKKELSSLSTCLHTISSKMQVMFPELRLIQYDCGKLQTLDRLLAKLKSGSHRVLIFTQMTKMLDVLEAFLNYHGHRYLRLDGTTRVEQRQVLMDRFNGDKRIFCFILSTRSGGIGVNLTGADTVIFYDSDWNPTMDAQAQDRCHRIGQTRDVHIYRLISDKTIEENILKKANQKRLLGDLAIEGGNFTTAFFKQQTLKELFEEPSGLESLAEEKAKAKEVIEKVREVATSAHNKPEANIKDANMLKQFEMALCKAEDETDVIAAKQVQAEQKAELAEFDESIPWDEKESENKKEEDEVSKVELELAQLEKELTPIERYAVGYVEAEMEPEEDSFDEEDIENSKKEWELARLKALKEEEERRAELEEDEMLYTYSMEDSHNQMFISDVDEEIMPLWAPPTPPQDDNDVYIDQSLLFLYEPNVMSESQLPPVHIRKEHKKPRIETVTTRKQKQRKEEPPRVPRSLFDRPTAIQQKLRREAKMQKLKGLVKPFRPTAPLMPNKTVMEPPDQDIPEWLINEDWSLLQSVQSLLNLPLNLQVVSPAVTINWDLVADVVNSGSRVYRTPKMCKYQYENVIIPREEGRILYDVSPRKQKKNKGLYKASFQSKNNRPMRTSNLFLQKGNADIKMLYSSRFDLVKAVSNKRTPTLKQTLANPTLRNPKHAAVLEENGITYDQPLNPLQVATNRAERIAREKKQSQAAAQQAAEQLAARTQAAAAAAQAANATVGAAVSAPTIAQAVQAQQLQPLVTGATTVMQSGAVQKLGQNVTAVSIARTISSTGNIIVNTPITSNFATINKTISRAVTVSQPTSIAVTSTQNVRAARPAGTPIELTAIATPQTAQVAGQTRATLQTGATTTLTPQRIATFTGLPTTVQQQLAQAAIAKGLSPQQINMLRQQSIVRHPTPQLRQQKYSLATDQIRQPIKRLPTPLAGQKVITTLQMVQGQKPGLINSDQIKQIQRQQQQQQQQRLLQQKAQGTVGSQGQITVQGTTTQMPTAQIIAQAQVQQVGVTPGTSQTPVVTLVKSTSQSSPVNISVNVGQQKHILTTRAAPFNAQQKMILTQKRTLQQHPQKGTTQLQKAQIPLLMNTSHKLGQHISGQQILQHLVKHQGGSISHIIPQTMIPVSSTGQQTQMITKVSIATTSASSQPITVSASPITVTQVPVSAAQIQAINVSTSQVTPSLIKTSVPQTATMQVRTVPSSVNVTQVKSAALTQSLVSQPIHVQTTPTMQQIQVGIQQAANVTQVPSPAATVQIQHTVPDTHISVASPSLQSAVGAQTVPQPAAVTTIVTSQSQVNQQQQPVKQYGMRTRNNPKS